MVSWKMLTKASIAAIKDELEDTKGPGTIRFDVSLAAYTYVYWLTNVAVIPLENIQKKCSVQ